MPVTDAQVRSAKAAEKRYELVDGDGLSLVVLPSGSKVWRLRYRTAAGERKRVVLGKYPDVGLSKARTKASSLRGKIADGEDPAAERDATRNAEHATLASVVATYIAEHSPVWKESTRRTYLSAIGTFTAWAAGERVKLAADLNADKLARFRAHAITLPRRAKKKGGSRRDVVSTGEKRSALAINCDLRAVKTMLQALRVAGRLPAITSSDTIRENLGAVDADVAKPKPLKPAAIAKLLAACERYDAETFAKTREGDTAAPKYEPIAPLVRLMLLSGMRLGEALALEWADIDLDEREILVRAGKTGRERSVDLGVSPALAKLLAAMKLRAGGQGRVFPQHTQVTVGDARRRLIAEYGAPAFLWSTRNSRPGERSAPTLRSTCGCYLTCAPAIFGGASAYMSAAQLGHGVQVAEKHYLGTLKRIPKDATTIEAAMEIDAAAIAELPTAKRGAK